MNESLLNKIPEEHHHKVAGVITLIIMAIIVGGGYIWMTWGDSAPPVVIQSVETKTKVIEGTVPLANLTEEQIKSRQVPEKVPIAELAP